MKLYEDGDVTWDAIGLALIFGAVIIVGMGIYAFGDRVGDTPSTGMSQLRRGGGQSAPSAKPLITFIETDKNSQVVPKWTRRLDPNNIGTTLMVNAYENAILFDFEMDWGNWKPSIGQMQDICGRNDGCYQDFGYRGAGMR